MTEPSPPTPTPGERRLARPPSERYRAAEEAAAARAAEAAGPPRPTSPGRGVAYGLLAGLGGAVLLTALGGIVTITDGLLVIAGLTGWAVAWAIRTGAGSTITERRRRGAAAAIAVAAVALGQAGLWWYAGTEGGVLSPIDYLGQVFGWLVPLELVIAGLLGWFSARVARA